MPTFCEKPLMEYGRHSCRVPTRPPNTAITKLHWVGVSGQAVFDRIRNTKRMISLPRRRRALCSAGTEVLFTACQRNVNPYCLKYSPVPTCELFSVYPTGLIGPTVPEAQTNSSRPLQHPFFSLDQNPCFHQPQCLDPSLVSTGLSRNI
jgi:hypothetical protein